MRSLLIGALILANASCTTLSNRRDLYSPALEYEPAAHATTVRTTTTTKTSNSPSPPAHRQPAGPITPEEEPVLPPP